MESNTPFSFITAEGILSLLKTIKKYVHVWIFLLKLIYYIFYNCMQMLDIDDVY